MRTKMAVLSIAVGLLLGGLAAPASAAPVVEPAPSPQCVLGCLEPGIVVSPHGGNAGTYSRNATVTLFWRVSNTSENYFETAVLAGATGCAMKVVPYVSPSYLDLAPGETAIVYTYVSGQCAGAGRVYASAGQDQGWRDIAFY